MLLVRFINYFSPELIAGTFIRGVAKYFQYTRVWVK